MIEGIKSVLSANPRWQVIGEANNGPGTVKGVYSLSPDLIVMDTVLAKLNGLAVALRIKKKLRKVRIIIYTDQIHPATIMDLIAAGISGYALKTGSMHELTSALQAVLQGGTYINGTVWNIIADNLKPNGKSNPLHQDKYNTLTSREQEIFQLLVEEKSVDQVANDLQVSPKTVLAHKYNIYKKLEVKNIHSLIRIATQRGIIGVESPAFGGALRLL